MKMINRDRRKFLQTTLGVAAVVSGDKEVGSAEGNDGTNPECPNLAWAPGPATISKALHAANLTLEFKLDPPVSAWTPASKSSEGSHTSYTGDGYTLDLEEQQLEGGHTLVTFVLRRASGERFTLHEYALRSESSFAGLDRVWMPFQPTTIGLPDEGHETALPSHGIPIVMGLDRRGTVNLAVAFFDQRIETEMQYRTMTHYGTLQPKGTLRLHLQRPTKGYSLGSVSEHRDGFFVSSGNSWFDTMQALRRTYDEKTGRPVHLSPDTAFEPLWVPWGGKPGKWEWGREEALDADDILA
jgi:hypothetical protein